MNFGEAIHAMQMNSVVRRSGWNGKGMFLYYVPEGRYAPSTGPGKWIASAGDDGKVPYGAYIAMKTAQGYVVPWLASQTDMLSDDWEVCDAVVNSVYAKVTLANNPTKSNEETKNTVLGVDSSKIVGEPINLYNIPAEGDDLAGLEDIRAHDAELEARAATKGEH